MTDENPNSLNILLVFGSVRRDRIGMRLVRYLAQHLEGRGHRAQVLDPLELDLPMLDLMYKEYGPGEAPAVMEQTARSIRDADAVVVVSAEYNHAIPPALANLLDHYLEEWFHRPAAIATYSSGRLGGARVAAPLRMMLGELGMPTISSILAVPSLHETLQNTGESPPDWVEKATVSFFDELEWWARAARRQMDFSGGPWS